MYRINQVHLPPEPSGNHIIARLSHEATARSLAEGTDATGRYGRLRAEAVAHDIPDGVWDELPPQDCIDEALMETFPASDPPAYSSCHV